MTRSPWSPGFFSACGPAGRSTSTPGCSIGVTTMKMMSSTRQTSTRGVTLMSPLTSSGLPPPAPNAICPPPLRFDASARFVLDEVVDQLRRGVRHLDVEALDLVEEVVVHPDRGHGDREAEGRRR